MSVDHYDGESGRHVLTMPEECAQDCSTPGQPADESVAYWMSRVTWHANDDELRRICKATGAWADDWDTADIDTIKGRVLWMAACDWRESEFYQPDRTED